MTAKANISLSELAEKGADADLLREMIQYVAQRMMDMDVESLCAAGYAERSPERLNSRNGYRERLWETRAGSVDLKIPKLRKGSYFPGFLEPRRTAEKALAAVIQEAYVQGVSTRSVDEPVKAMGMQGISKSQVSRLCAEIDERVGAFLERPSEGDWPYLWIDATYIKCREAGRIVSKAAIIAVAVNTEGVRGVLGMATGPSEAEPFWSAFLRSLTRRGLRGVKLVISDAHEGLKAAAAKVLSAPWHDEPIEFFHFRDRYDYEVDIVIEDSRGHVVGIEAKAAATVTGTDFFGMRKLTDACGKRFIMGLVPYDHDTVVPFGEKLLAVPVSTLWQ